MSWRLKEPPRGRKAAASIAQRAIELRTKCAVDVAFLSVFLFKCVEIIFSCNFNSRPVEMHRNNFQLQF
jgi:hypothetical protein